MLAFFPGPLAPVPTVPVGYDAGAGLTVLAVLVALSGATVLLAALVERGRRWCTDRARHAGVPASLPA